MSSSQDNNIFKKTSFLAGNNSAFIEEYYSEYLKEQIGNPDGSDVPNKKYYDPRAYNRAGELTFKARLTRSFNDLNNLNTNA